MAKFYDLNVTEIEIDDDTLKDEVSGEFDIEDIFEKKVYDDWAIDYVINNHKVEDVYDEDDLKEWADQNGYVKEE
jgi:hypothetical protein